MERRDQHRGVSGAGDMAREDKVYFRDGSKPIWGTVDDTSRPGWVLVIRRDGVHEFREDLVARIVRRHPTAAAPAPAPSRSTPDGA